MELTDKMMQASGKVLAIVIVCICIGLLIKIRKNEKE